MFEIFKNYQVLLLIIMAILLAIGFLVMAFKYVKTKGLEGIRNDVYKLFLKAERAFVKSGMGPERMKWVIQKARGLLPSWLRFIISESLLKKIVQYWFDGIKDLLDDGKLNNSTDKDEGGPNAD